MTTCPMCDTVRMVCISEFPFERDWHVNCDCGWAWANSSFFSSKWEARNAWEKQMQQREKMARHAEEVYKVTK